MKINIHTSHPSAFISSTFLDLREERNATANVLREAGLNVNALDVKPASNDTSKREIENSIKESDFIIVIIGQRYGSIIHEMTGSNRFSITRWEYIKAKHYKKDVLVYFKEVNAKDPIWYDDKNNDFDMKRNYLIKFKELLSTKHNPKYFSTADELANEIKKALIPTYRDGVKRLLMEIETQSLEIKRLQKENNLYNNQLSSLKSKTTPVTDYKGIAPRTNIFNKGIHQESRNILSKPQRSQKLTHLCS